MEILNPIPPAGAHVPNARLGFIMTGLIVAGLALLAMRGVDWFLLRASLRHRFPKVEWITTQQLSDWLADKHREKPVLLDVRTEDEWKVSHLRGARRVDPSAPTESAAAGIGKDAPIVTYCAVGYRSGDLATKLRDAGFKHVQNLEGSIFQWGNEHRPMVQGDKPVSLVHPYNKLWGPAFD